MRLILAAVVGGIVLFLWGAVTHTLLPTAHSAYKPLPDEAAVIGGLRGVVSEPGLYMFPYLDMRTDPDEARQAEWAKQYSAGPSGLLIVRPPGGDPMAMGRFLGLEFLASLLAAFVAALVASLVSGGFRERALALFAFGVVAWLSLSASEWIWYGFPPAYVLGVDAVDQLGGWLLAGLAMAGLIRPRAPAP